MKFGFSKTTAMTLHSAVCAPVFGYAAYHVLFANMLIGVLALVSGGILLLSALNLYRDEEDNRYTKAFVLSISTALLATCYYFGMRGLILMFPLISAFFYSFGYRSAVRLSIVFSAAALVVSLNMVDAITVARTAIAMGLTILLTMSFLLLVNRQQEEIEREAGEDYLTGVLNRRSFSAWLNREIPRAIEHGREIALLYIDLDDFKRINDAYGHATGDKLLQQVSERIQTSTRAGDRLGSLDEKSRLARLSGDEFSLVLVDVSGPQAVEAVVERLFQSLAEVFVIDSVVLSVNASIGIAMSGADGESFESLLKNADAAMYQVKREGKKRYQFFNEDIAKRIREENEIEQALLLALEESDFELHYMPIYNTDTLAVSAVEVLLRSGSNQLQNYGTERYIQIAEERGLIYQIDLMVLEKALQKMVSVKTIPVLKDIPFCINISAKELLNPDFYSDFEALLREYPVKPQQIELEITETSLVASNQSGIAILEDLKSLGVSLSLDDFGTGYTAFNQLSAYPVDTLKIDRMFVDAISSHNAQDNSMVNVILTLAEIYGLRVIAEGVENVHQLLYLNKRDCHFVQGYLLSKPLPWSDFVEHAMSKLEYSELTSSETAPASVV
ncbi:MAG: putative bifunctional diguanylate cyclase/phosphodiesterase [Halioglobus sp.]